MSNKELTELNSYIAEYVMGWEQIEVDYYSLKPTKTCTAAGMDGSYNTPSCIKWEKALNDDGAESVGTFWGDPKTGKIVEWRDDGFGKQFNPTTDPAAAMAVLEKCGETTCVSVFKTIGGQWNVFSSSLTRQAQPVFAENLPLAICLFAKQLFAKPL